MERNIRSSVDHELLTPVKSLRVFSKYLGFPRCPACWARSEKGILIISKNSLRAVYKRVHLCNCLQPVVLVCIRWEDGWNRRWGRRNWAYTVTAACMWLRVGAVQSESNVGKRKTTVFKTPYGNKTLQSNMAYSDAFTMKLPVITPTRLLLCNSICYFDGISPPPPTQILYQLQVASLHLYCFHCQFLFPLFKLPSLTLERGSAPHCSTSALQ